MPSGRTSWSSAHPCCSIHPARSSTETAGDPSASCCMPSYSGTCRSGSPWVASAEPEVGDRVLDPDHVGDAVGEQPVGDAFHRRTSAGRGSPDPPVSGHPSRANVDRARPTTSSSTSPRRAAPRRPWPAAPHPTTGRTSPAPAASDRPPTCRHPTKPHPVGRTARRSPARDGPRPRRSGRWRSPPPCCRRPRGCAPDASARGSSAATSRATVVDAGGAVGAGPVP